VAALAVDDDAMSLHPHVLYRARLSTDGSLAERTHLDGILESLTDPFQLFDAEWRFVYVNPAARRVFARHGVDPDWLIGKRFWEDVFPDAGESEQAREMRRAMDERAPVAFEHYFAPWDCWHLVRFDPLPDGGMANYFQDITERKRGEERVRAHEQRLAADLARLLRLHDTSARLVAGSDGVAPLIDIVDAAIALTDADLGNIQLLDEATGTLRIVASRGFGRAFLEHFDSARNEQAACGWAMHRGERVVVEDVTVSPIFAGTDTLPVLLDAGVRAVQSTPLTGRSGRLVGMLSTHYRVPRRPAELDIEIVDMLARLAADWIERTQAEDLRRQTDERFRRYFELGLVGMSITSPSKGCLAVNDRLCSILGYTREELLRKRWDEVTHPADLAGDEAQFERVVAGETDGYSLEKRFIRRDGRIVEGVMSVSCVRRPDRSIDYFVALVDDVTERKAAERALRASEERYRGLVEQVRDYAIFSTDAGGVITSWNEGCRQVLGYSEHEFLGVDVELLFTPEDRSDGVAAARFGLAVETGAARIDGWMLARDARRFFANGGVTALMDPVQGCTGYSVILRDVTQSQMSQEETAHRGESLAQLVTERTDALKQATERLRLSERMAALGTLAAGLGHDLGNLLLPLDVRLQMLARAELAPELRDHVTGIASCVRYLQRLAGGLSLLVTDPTHHPLSEPTELRSWWSDVSMLLRNLMPRGIVFQGDMTAAETWVSIGRVGLTQAVFNTVQNAADALRVRSTGCVQVSLEPGDRAGTVAIRVTDDGVGMTEDVARHCMEPYFSTKARGISTGMGLALIHGLVTAAGGHVEITSTRGVGTTVRLVLPGARLPTRPRDAEPHVAIVRVKDARVRAYLREELRALGFTVRSRRAGAQPDVIIVDSTRTRDSADVASRRRRGMTLSLGPNPNRVMIQRALQSAAATIIGTGADAGLSPPA
jgi:PAS domain S-box-containing protein